MTVEVARVVSAPRIKHLGAWCALIAVAMWYGMNAAGAFLFRISGGGGLTTLYILVTFGFAIRAGHDLLIWLARANEALNEKTKFEAMGLSAAIKWAHEKDIRDAMNGSYKGDPEGTAEMMRMLEAKYGKI